MGDRGLSAGWGIYGIEGSLLGGAQCWEGDRGLSAGWGIYGIEGSVLGGG